MPLKNKDYYWDLGTRAIWSLEAENGILASDKNELYGCIFGRDSCISALKLLRVYRRRPELDWVLPLTRKIILNLVLLSGKQVNIESGEQPGKAIHEFRLTGHEHLTRRQNRPWYVYDDQVMRNYDSVDATPLLLILIYRFWQATGDGLFINQVRPTVLAGLSWMSDFGDSDGDGLIDYELSKARESGGLATQNWMDSEESVFHETGDTLVYPLAPVEVQAYAYLAYRLWARYFLSSDPMQANQLMDRADALKRKFNESFPARDPDGNAYLAYKLDGLGRQFKSVRSNMGHVLWASLSHELDGQKDSILEPGLVHDVVRRLTMPDMFETAAGIRTLSTLSRRFEFNSYHNGSIWPHDNAMIAEGFEIHGYKTEAEQVYLAILNAIGQFGTPIELFVYNGSFTDYLSPTGQHSCRVQAWSAASILDACANLPRLG